MLVVWKLDRLGRNLARLVNTVQDLSARGVGLRVGLRVLAGDGAQIDTTTAAGHLVFGIFAALAEFGVDVDPAPPSPDPRLGQPPVELGDQVGGPGRHGGFRPSRRGARCLRCSRRRAHWPAPRRPAAAGPRRGPTGIRRAGSSDARTSDKKARSAGPEAVLHEGGSAQQVLVLGPILRWLLSQLRL